jgi:hypothetical protein
MWRRIGNAWKKSNSQRFFSGASALILFDFQPHAAASFRHATPSW